MQFPGNSSHLFSGFLLPCHGAPHPVFRVAPRDLAAEARDGRQPYYAVESVVGVWGILMEVQEILSHLERNEGHFARSAVREAVAHRDEIIPPLLEVLESAARDPQSFARDPNRMIHLHAMYLLAQFRETRAYPLLVQMFSAPGELLFDLAGDTVTEGLDSILASVSDGDMTGMASLVENERANEYVRSAALKGLVTLVACGKRSR